MPFNIVVFSSFPPSFEISARVQWVRPRAKAMARSDDSLIEFFLCSMLMGFVVKDLEIRRFNKNCLRKPFLLNSFGACMVLNFGVVVLVELN